VLFSNYWAGRAMFEADLAARRWLAELAAAGRREPGVDGGGHDGRSTMRLFGRDPRHVPDGPYRFMSPPSKCLHPWFLLPAVFAALVLVLPFSIGLIRTGVSAEILQGGAPSEYELGPLRWKVPLGALVAFLLLVLADPVLARWQRGGHRGRLTVTAGVESLRRWEDLCRSSTTS